MADQQRAGGVAPVHFVGAGPGDPELLTLRALNSIRQAEVVLHDQLVSDEILALVPASAMRVPVGKAGFGSSVSQDRINDLIVLHAISGARVVRLKGGDPLVFARLDEETEALDAAGIEWIVVPGITAAMAAAASLGRSLTRRGRNAGLRLISARTAEGLAEHDWGRLATGEDVAAVYMGKRSARFVQGRLMIHGANPAMPVSVVENASRPDERVIETVLARLPEDLELADVTGPAVILLGLAGQTAAVALEAAE